MAIVPRLELRQGQSLVMTPQLQQAIKLLQLSSMELLEYVEQEIEENPMLEHDDDAAAGDSGSNDEAFDRAEDHRDETMDRVNGEEYEDADVAGLDLADSDSVDTARLDALDTEDDGDWAGDAHGADMVVDSAYSLGGNGKSHGGSDSAATVLEQTLSQEVTLHDHLMAQISLDIGDPGDRLIAAYLTETLDQAGRVTEELEAVASALNCDVERVEAVLTRLQTMDPPGIFARSLVECWAIQLRERDRLDPAMQTLIDNVELLKAHDYAKLAKLCGVDMDDVRDMIDEIWSLNHRPAEAFDHIVAQPVTPDVLMRSGPGGKWIVELNNDTLPRVLVNNHYYTEVSGMVRTREEKAYVAEKFQSANWLVKALHQRATTILKVAREIVRQQDAFFAKGVEHLKPLVLRDIADEIEMHESTVSRVTSNKYIHTPRGIYELKYFFTQAIASSAGGDAHSAESVRHRIKALIDNESKDAILSDDKMVEILNQEGIGIARRTVAKYRESMKIPSSVQRRREKALMA